MPGRAEFDVAVIGAGAAGMFAAAGAASRGRSVLLLEKNRKAGVKILMSGGTRCNLTHATDRRGIADAFGRQGRFLHSPLASLGPEDLIARLEALGVRTKVEATGKVFPASDRALDVQRACLRMVEESGAQVALDCAVHGLERADDHYRITTSQAVYTAAQVVLTTGGQSYPGCGTTGDGYAWAKALGHRIVPPRPALAPLTSTAKWVHQLSGLTLPDVSVKAVLPGERAAGPLRGSLLFTHFGLSGPVAMNLSREITERPSAGWTVLVDLAPDTPEQQVLESLKQGGQAVGAVLQGWAPRSLAESLCSLATTAPQTRVAELSRPTRRRLCDLVKQLPTPIAGTLGFKKAEVTAGGVALGEVDSRTMQSKVSPGLYLAGEVLDLDGPIGGYNFQAAFSTGWLAGLSV